MFRAVIRCEARKETLLAAEGLAPGTLWRQGPPPRSEFDEVVPPGGKQS